MRVDLVTLLTERSLSHPTRIVEALFKGDDLRMHVVGWPWWLPDGDTTKDHSIHFVFEHLGEGFIEPRTFDQDETEALEPFEVMPSSQLAWAQPNGFEVYCNAPLREPLEIYARVNDFLAQTGSFRGADWYLNFSYTRGLAGFAGVAQSNSYLLARVPPALHRVVTEELQRQHVSYNEIPTKFGSPGELLVTIQNSQFFCRTAFAEFDG